MGTRFLRHIFEPRVRTAAQHTEDEIDRPQVDGMSGGPVLQAICEQPLELLPISHERQVVESAEQVDVSREDSGSRSLRTEGLALAPHRRGEAWRERGAGGRRASVLSPPLVLDGCKHSGLDPESLRAEDDSNSARDATDNGGAA